MAGEVTYAGPRLCNQEELEAACEVAYATGRIDVLHAIAGMARHFEHRAMQLDAQAAEAAGVRDKYARAAYLQAKAEGYGAAAAHLREYLAKVAEVKNGT